ncbi:MAG: ATP synthase F0 subunit B [Deltaproteobacteria bacterium]|nr:ATP synthase F0 subunit B [Deltaproteobacteria bacterium]MBW2594693.1 ATP synthase F0 subunit B [Deltaproteobacteria bacterium]MBW2649532.1 ATP synthase F0 subunit B [Deltaproteobacteria bacterium]
MVELNYTVWIQMANFLLLILLLNFLLYKPVLKIIEKRDKKIEESNEEVRSLDETIKRKMARYEEQIRQARTEAAAQRDEIEKEGTEQGEVITGKVRNEISKKMEDFKADMQKEADEARGVLRDQTRTIAGEISEKILGRGI